MILFALTLLAAQRIGGGWEGFHSTDWVGAQNSFTILGDCDGDGLDELLAGKASWPTAGEGGVVILSGANGAEWMRIVRPTFSFGAAVAALGDLDADGVPDFAVGAPDANANGLTRNGSVEVFSGATGASLYLRTGFNPGGRFGAALTAVAAPSGVGPADLLVSAPEITPNATGGRGVVYFFTGVGGVLRFTVDGPPAFASNGWNTADARAFAGPGQAAFALAAPAATIAGIPNVGEVRVFSAQSGATLAVLARGGSSRFGDAVAHVPDMDGDGRDDLAISEGLWGAQPAVHLYGAATGLRTSIPSAPYSAFGASLLGADFDHDGIIELAIGHPSHSPPGLTGAGGVFIHRTPDGEPIARLEGTVSGAGLGASLHLARNDRSGGSGPDLVAEARAAWTTRLAEHMAFQDRLHADAEWVSAHHGGTISLRLHFPANESGQPYLLLASAAGAGSTNFGGLEVPLQRDALYQRMILQPPAMLNGARGRLDASGEAAAALILPPRVARPWIGRTIHLAAVSVEAWLGCSASIAVPIEILP